MLKGGELETRKKSQTSQLIFRSGGGGGINVASLWSSEKEGKKRDAKKNGVERKGGKKTTVPKTVSSCGSRKEDLVLSILNTRGRQLIGQ